MGYDHDNRVTNVVNEGTANAYEYDGLGDRISPGSDLQITNKKVDGEGKGW